MQKLRNLIELNKEKIIFFSVLFFLIFAIALTSKYYDLDLWARLIVGKAFWQSRVILKEDFLSYIQTDTWFDHEWGSSVLFYAFYKLFSFHGFLILHVFLTFLTFFFIKKTLELRGVKHFSFILFAISIFAFLDTNNFVVRCQSITFLFFTVYLYIFEQARLGNRKYLWITPFIMLIWCNMHGGCASGIGLFLIYMLGEFLSQKDFKYFILPCVLNLLVLPLNPWGIDYLFFLAYANTLNRMWVVEWYPLFDKVLFGNSKFVIKTFVMFSFLTGIIYLIKAQKKDWTKVVLTLSTLILGLNHIKHLPFAVICVMIFFYEDIYNFIKLLSYKINYKSFSKYFNLFTYVSLVVFVIYAISVNGFKPKVGSFYPYKSVEFIKINHIKGNLLCDFSTGSFIEYKLYPQNKVYMDGRYEELYSFEDLKRLMFFLYAEVDEHILLDNYPTDIILARNGYTVLDKLIKSKKWTPIYYEEDFITLVKTENLKDNYINPSDNIDYYQKTLFDTDINFMLKSNGNERN